jgi:zinc transporter, ZIP family
MNVATVFFVALVTALATGFGALPLLLGHRIEGLLGLGTAVAAGFMAGASVGLVWEGIGTSAERTVLGAVLGVAFIVVARGLLGHRRHMEFGALRGADALGALMIVGVMTMHSFTEGLGIGVSFGDGATLGALIATAIAVHNIPEGLAISLVLVPHGVSVMRAAAWSVFSSLPQPLMAVPAYLLVQWFEPVLAVGLGFAAGAMIWMVTAQLLPEALRTSSPASVAAAVGAAAAAMIALQIALLG